MKAARLLFEEEIRRLIDPSLALSEVRRAFAALGRGEVSLPGVIHLAIPEEDAEVHVKGAHIHGSPFYAIKVASSFPRNLSRGLPIGDGAVLVFNASTGALRAILLDNGYLTELRTGSAGALAADLLSRKSAERVGILGAGSQARYQLEALLLVRLPREVLVFSNSRAALYADEMREKFKIEVRVAESPQELVESSDIVVTTTPARSPIVRSEWVRKGTHVTAVGSDAAYKQELDPALLSRADKVVPDSLEQCLAIGEVHHAVATGVFSRERVHAELGEIAAGLRPGRSSEEEITVCDLTGVGIQDSAVASAVVIRAEKEDVGRVLNLA